MARQSKLPPGVVQKKGRWYYRPTSERERAEQVRWAREEALPQLEALIARDEYTAAFDLASQVAAVIPGDPRLKSLESSYTRPITLKSSPAGATVQYRPYGGKDSDWRSIGRTPAASTCPFCPTPRARPAGPRAWS